MKEETNNQKTNWQSVKEYVSARIILWMMYLILIYLLKFIAPQIAQFIVQVSPMENMSWQEQYDHAFNYAIAIEICVFLLTSIGKSGAAKWFVAISITTQLLFMHRWDAILLEEVWQDPERLSAGIRLLLGSMVFSSMSAIGIFYVSEQIKQQVEQLRASEEQPAAARQQLISEMELTISQLRGELKIQRDLIKQLNEPPSFECPECKGTFKSQAALNGHMRVHSPVVIQN